MLGICEPLKDTLCKAKVVLSSPNVKDIPVKQQHALLAAHGYSVAHKLLNSNRFGLPQARPRIFMVYIRDDCGTAAQAGNWECGRSDSC